MSWFTKIKAKDGCVIYIPPKDKKDAQIIYGATYVRRGSKEWVQIRTSDLVDIEIRLEGNNSVNLGKGLSCEVVAKLLAQIDETDLKKSLPKVVERFRCSTTTNIKSILNGKFFAEKITSNFRGILYHIVNQIVYEKLLNDANYTTELKNQLENDTKKFLGDCGFTLINCDLIAIPLDPGVSGEISLKSITDIWTQREKERLRIEEERNEIVEEAKEESEKNEIARNKERRDRVNEDDINKKEAERDFAQSIHEIEIEMQQNLIDKDRQLAEARKANEEFFNQRQEDKDKYKHTLEMTKIDDQEEIEEREHTRKFKNIQNEIARSELQQNDERKNENEALTHKEEIQERKLAVMVKEKEIAENEFEINKLKVEVDKLKNLADSEIKEAQLRAENIVSLKTKEMQNKMLTQLFQTMPEIMKNIPIEKIGDSTFIHVGKEIDLDSLKGSYGILGLALLPILKDLYSKISEKISVPLSFEEMAGKNSYEKSSKEES